MIEFNNKYKYELSLDDECFEQQCVGIFKDVFTNQNPYDNIHFNIRIYIENNIASSIEFEPRLGELFPRVTIDTINNKTFIWFNRLLGPIEYGSNFYYRLQNIDNIIKEIHTEILQEFSEYFP